MPGRLCLLVALLLLAGCATPGGRGAAPGPDDQALAGALKEARDRAGDNAPALRAFLAAYEPGSEGRAAAEFLAAGLPLADAALMTADELREHVDLALQARQEFPWCAALPWPLFLHYVLPHRVAQEPAQPWRRRLYKALRAEAAGAPDVRAVVLAVNRRVWEWAGYAPSDRVDQGPLETMARGWGRCEELAILLVDALRSVGVAARPCGAPWWRHTDDNHLWVEVWDTSAWRYVGAGEVDSDLDLAWFSPHLHQVGTVRSLGYGAARAGAKLTDALAGGPVADLGRGALAVDRTRAYLVMSSGGQGRVLSSGGHGRVWDAGSLEVEVSDQAGRPAAKAQVYVSVFNYGALRTTAGARADGQGRCSFVLGPGDYLLTAAGQGVGGLFVSAEAGRTSLARLRLGTGAPEGERLLRFPIDRALMERLDRDVAALQERVAPARAALEAGRLARQEALALLAAAILGCDAPDRDCLDTPLGKALLASGRNMAAPLLAWVLAGADLRPVLADMWARLGPKDMAACTGAGLLADARALVRARRAVQAKGWYAAMDPEEYARGVVPGRVLDEPMGPWRAEFWERFGPWLERAPDARSLALRVNRVSARLGAAKGFILAPDTPPAAVLRSGRAASDRDRAVFAVAVLRALGVPARMAVCRGQDMDWAEFHDGRGWLPLYPSRPEALGDPQAVEAARVRYAEPAALVVRFERQGRALGPDEAAYARDFSLERFTADGRLESLDDPGLEWAGDRAVLLVPPGQWLLVCGARDRGGRPLVRTRVLDLRSGQRLEVLCPLDPGEGL